MTIYTRDAQTLSAKSRGYRQPGKKLLPRCAFDNMEMKYLKLHSVRELNRQRAQDASAQGPNPYSDDEVASHWKKVHRLEDALSTRSRKLVWAVLGDFIVITANPTMPNERRSLGRNQLRAVRAHEDAHSIEAAMQWDRNTLANAY